MSNVTSLRMRVLPRYPARISGATGLAVVSENPDLVIKPDFGSLAEILHIDAPATTFSWWWNKDNDSYGSISFENLLANIQEVVIGENLTGLSEIVSGADKVPYFIDSAGNASAYTVSEYVRTISGAVDDGAFRASLGLGTSAPLDVGTTAGTVAAGDDERIVGALQRGQLGVCFPEDFGAIGNGVTDDTGPMQAAFNDGRQVILRRGAVYLVSTLRPRDNLVVMGDGTPTIKQIGATENNLIGPTHISGSTLEDVAFSGVVFEGFTLDGNKENQTIGSNGIQNLIRGEYKNFTFRRLKFVNSVRGDVRLAHSQDGTIECCQFLKSGKWLGGLSDGSAMQGLAVYGKRTRNITVTRNYFLGMGAEVYAAFPNYTGGVNSIGVIVENEAYGVNIIDNYFTEICNESIQYIRWDAANPNVPDLANRPGKSIVAFNRFDGNYRGMYALTVGENADNLLVIGNHVRRMTSHGMKAMQWMRDCTFSDNMIERCKGSGIYVVTGAQTANNDVFGAVKIQGNTVEFCDGHGVQVVGLLGHLLVGLSIQHNILRNNGQGGSGSAIRIAVSLRDGMISGNNCYDDQDLKTGGTKTQNYGLLIENVSGGPAVFTNNACLDNKFTGNKTGSASIVGNARQGFVWAGNIEGTNPQLYAAKIDYSINASSATTGDAVGASYVGRPLFATIVPKSDAGANAFGSAIVAFGANASGEPFAYVRNLQAAARAVGTVYVFAR